MWGDPGTHIEIFVGGGLPQDFGIDGGTSWEGKVNKNPKIGGQSQKSKIDGGLAPLPPCYVRPWGTPPHFLEFYVPPPTSFYCIMELSDAYGVIWLTNQLENVCKSLSK